MAPVVEEVSLAAFLQGKKNSHTGSAEPVPNGMGSSSSDLATGTAVATAPGHIVVVPTLGAKALPGSETHRAANGLYMN